MKKSDKAWRDFILAMLLLTIILLLASCSAAKKEAREIAAMQVYAVRYPGPFKILANQEDPCFPVAAKSDTVIKIDSVIIAGKTDTVFTRGKGDTIIKTITIKLPGTIKNTTKTIHDTIPDNRALQSCQAYSKRYSDSLITVKTQLAGKTKAASKYQLWFWLLAGSLMALIVGFAVIKTYLFFSGGAIVKAGSGIINEAKKII